MSRPTCPVPTMREIADKIDRVTELAKQAQQRIAKLEAENAELRAATQWRPIEEAPRHGPWMPVWTGYPRGWAKGHWSVFAEAWTDEDGEEICPTHFMPAPAPPKEAESGYTINPTLRVETGATPGWKPEADS